MKPTIYWGIPQFRCIGKPAVARLEDAIKKRFLTQSTCDKNGNFDDPVAIVDISLDRIAAEQRISGSYQFFWNATLRITTRHTTYGGRIIIKLMFDEMTAVIDKINAKSFRDSRRYIDKGKNLITTEVHELR